MQRIIASIFLTLISLTTLYGCQSVDLTAAQKAVLLREGFELTDDGWELNVSAKLLFATASEELTPEIKERIAHITRELLKVSIEKVRLEGHTDNTGSSAFNDELSLRRARTVAQVMIDAGMSPQKITTIGRGQRKPLYDNNTAEGRRENRRVSIIVDTSF